MEVLIVINNITKNTQTNVFKLIQNKPLLSSFLIKFLKKVVINHL